MLFNYANNCYYEKDGSEVRNITDEIPFEIPDSWVFTKLEFFTKSIGNKKNQIQTKNILKEGLFPVISQGKNFIDGYSNNYSKVIHLNNTPAIMFGDHTKNVKYINFDFIIGADGTKFFTPYLANPKYIYYAILYFSYIIDSRGYARHYSLLKKQFFPLPPLAEQERIVKEIERYEPLIAEYDKLEKESTELDSEIKNKLKKSILQYALQGKLVEQDPNDEPASVLLEKIRAEKKAKLGKKYVDSYIYKGDDNCYYEKIGDSITNITDLIPFEIPKNWALARLGNIGDWGAGATPNRTIAEYYNGNIPWLKTGELNNGIVYDSVEKVTEKALKECSLRYNKKGDVLIAMYGATIGKLAIAGIDLTTNQACCACTPNNNIHNIFLFYYLMSQKDNFIKMGEGGAQPNISREKLINFIIPIPPYKEQLKIINKIDIFLKLIE